MKHLSLLLLALPILSACAGLRPASDATTEPSKAENITMDPMLVRPGSGSDGSIYVSELFDSAFRAFSNRMYEDAVRDYETIIEHFSDNRFYLPSLYNAGLAYEKLERWEDAVRVYRLIVTEFPDKEDTTDAYYRLAVALQALEEHQQIVDLMTEVLLRAHVTPFDRVEAHVRRANALLQLGDYHGAADGFRNALTVNNAADPEERLASDAQFIVQAHFGIGRAFHHLTSEIKLVLPTERMGEDLKAKAELFTTAQANYIRALAQHHPQWSMAAGYMIGRLYEDFYHDILAAEVPADLSEDHLAVYFEVLREQIRPLMERAVQVYEKNLSLSKRIVNADESEWVAETEKHLFRLTSYLEDAATQQRAERFVRERRDLKLLWEPIGFAQDHVATSLIAAQAAAHQ